ncbi:hypothetical protein HN011_000185 [Eciton burchellii]|nr:hypothetical protein HN011_000185 [Eciton burchellii]
MSKEDNSESQDALGPDVPAGCSDVPAKDPSGNRVYDNRGPKKIIRVVTVIAYLFSVSFVGIILSAYYIFLWEPPNPRLVGHPQMQFLIAAVPEVANPKERETRDSLLESEPNRTALRIADSLLARMTQDARYDGDYDDEIDSAQSVRRPDQKISLEKQERLSRMLFRLGQSLVKVLRARNENSSRQQLPNDSRSRSVQAKRPHDSAKQTDHARLWVSARDESRGNVVREKALDDNTNPSSEFRVSSTKTLNADENASATASEALATIPGTGKTNHGDFDGESAADVDSTRIAIDRNGERGELDVQRRPSSEIHARRFQRQQFVNAKRDETRGDDRRLIAPIDDANPSRDPNLRSHSTIATTALRSEEYDWKKRNQSESRLAKNAVNAVNINNSVINDRGNKTSSANRRVVTRGRVSLGLPIPSDSIEHPEFDHRPPNHHPIALRTTINIQETQIEKITPKSTTMEDKHPPQETDSSTPGRQRGLWEILTETANTEETSAEPTSMSTARNYRNDLTSVANDDDESVT